MPLRSGRFVEGRAVDASARVRWWRKRRRGQVGLQLLVCVSVAEVVAAGSLFLFQLCSIIQNTCDGPGYVLHDCLLLVAWVLSLPLRASA